MGGFVSINSYKRLEKSLKTVGKHNYSKVKFSHPLGLTVFSYRTSVGTTVSQHVKSYRTVFPQFLFKFGGLMVESTRVHQI